MTARAIIGLLPPGVGAQRRGHATRAADPPALPRARAVGACAAREIGLILQDPFTMLNPLLRCGRHIDEVAPRRPRAAARRGRPGAPRPIRRLAEVGIDRPRRWRSLSVPALRRHAPARRDRGRARARPDVLIADEPSTALDVTTQKEILALLEAVQETRGMGLDPDHPRPARRVLERCDRIYVLYAGALVEVAPARTSRREPLHPYTLGLLLSEPPVETTLAELPRSIPGTVPPARRDARTLRLLAPAARGRPRLCDAGRAAARRGRARSLQSACMRLAEIRDEMSRRMLGRQRRSRAVEADRARRALSGRRSARDVVKRLAARPSRRSTA